MSKNCLVINLNRCSGCDSCIAACKYENHIELGRYWNHVLPMGPTGTFPNVEMYWLPMQCQQCANPGCIEVCPTGASYRDDETGVVLINADDCIGCQACLTGCPYGVRMLNDETNVVEKCTLCTHKLEAGEEWEPACVHNCPCGARLFGDLDDPDSTVSQAVAEAGEENCHKIFDPGSLEPSTIYILSEKIATWQDDPVDVSSYER